MESCELTEEEKAAAIEEAARRKKDLFKYQQDQDRRKRWEQELQRRWGPEELLTYVTWKADQHGEPLVIDDQNHSVVKALCYYFADDPRFEEFTLQKFGEKLYLQKGIMLCGGVGVGKTFLMNIFRANQRRSFQVISCRDIADIFAKEGHEILHYYSEPAKVPTHASTFYQNAIGMCFDDLGTEGTKRHYGDQVNVMADVLLNRYDKAVTPFHYTHVTTNLNVDEIEQYYGTRVRSRMREMFNMITLDGEDRRK